MQLRRVADRASRNCRVSLADQGQYSGPREGQNIILFCPQLWWTQSRQAQGSMDDQWQQWARITWPEAIRLQDDQSLPQAPKRQSDNGGAGRTPTHFHFNLTEPSTWDHLNDCSIDIFYMPLCIFNIFGMNGPSVNQELNPNNHLVSAESPL